MGVQQTMQAVATYPPRLLFGRDANKDGPSHMLLKPMQQLIKNSVKGYENF